MIQKSYIIHFLTVASLTLTACSSTRATTSSSGTSQTAQSAQAVLSLDKQKAIAAAADVGLIYDSGDGTLTGSSQAGEQQIQMTIQLIQQIVQDVESLDTSNESNESNETQIFQQDLLSFLNELLSLLQTMVSPNSTLNSSNLSLSLSGQNLTISPSDASFNISGMCNDGGYPSNVISWQLELNGAEVRNSGMIANGENMNSQCVDGVFTAPVDLGAVASDDVNRTGLMNPATGLYSSYQLVVTITGYDSNGNPYQNTSVGTKTMILLPLSGLLQVTPSQINLSVSQSYQLEASGGIAPYSYQVTSGACTVTPSGGLVTAGATASTCVITVSDTSNDTATVDITVTN